MSLENDVLSLRKQTKMNTKNKIGSAAFQARSGNLIRTAWSSAFMVKVFAVALVFLLQLPANVSAQEVSESVKNGIIQAVENGSARDMAKYFGANVELSLPGNEGTFSKSQSEIILKDFFSKNAAGSFSLNHEGASRDGSAYFIGTYKSAAKKSFRTYFLLKKVNGNFVLHQVQFQESRN